MLIDPGMAAAPLVSAPGSQVPSSPLMAEAGNGASAPLHAEFQSMLGNGAAGAPTQPAGADPQAYRQGTVAPGNRLGDQVLSSLKKLGQNVEGMGAWGAEKPGAKKPGAKAQPPSAPSPDGTLNGAPSQGASSAVSEMRDLFDTGMRQQSQMYATVFNFELVQESSQSMLKSLKSLLTQGGG